MQWKLFANLAETAGTKEVTVDVGPGDTFRDAFEALLETHPELREEVLDEDGELREHIRVLRNERNPFVSHDGYDTVLEEGDTLALFPPVSGGAARTGPSRARSPGRR
jgi:molybdopterin synthase sulfur carrier subunit